MRIAVFDYQVIRTNPIGGCHRRMLAGLADEHEFTVFSVVFENPRPDRIKWVRIPAPLRPLALLFVAYHILAPIIYWLHRFRTGARFDLVQMVESNLSFGDISYAHFCHTAFLQNQWKSTQSGGLRGFLRWLDHRLHAWLEKGVFNGVRDILVPSRGLADELSQQFPEVSQKICVLPNAVDVLRLNRPDDYQRDQFRHELSVEPDDVVFCFAALGHFERKGLPFLLEAFSKVRSKKPKLLVVGGTPDLIASYRERAEKLQLKDQVIFVGMQPDIRPHLWASDAFAFASAYETFSLAAYEAAAASLPLITPKLHGIEEIVTDGATGYVIRRNPGDIAAALENFLQLTPESRSAMGEEARLRASLYDEPSFLARWRHFYSEQQAKSLSSETSSPAIEPVETCR